MDQKYDRPEGSSTRPVLMWGGVLVAVMAALLFYHFSGRYESTDDAYVHMQQVGISSNVSGRILDIDVREEQSVHAGEVLFHLDPARFDLAVKQAQAKVDTARLHVNALRAEYLQNRSDAELAAIEVQQAKEDLVRERHLYTIGVHPRQDLDHARDRFKTAGQVFLSAQAKSAVVLAKLGGRDTGPVDQVPMVAQSMVALAMARLEQSYTTIVAPENGVLARVDELAPGDAIAANVPVFALMVSAHPWIEANFKEDQMVGVKEGRPAVVTIDACPGNNFKAHVVSISPGTGAQFSVLPPENSTGNWVKVVQRIPVRIEFDRPPRQCVLRAGLSVSVRVDTQHSRPWWPF